ncbi:MAG: helix-turn-helix domain-containing protein [Candidatus Nitrotoga sp.]
MHTNNRPQAITGIQRVSTDAVSEEGKAAFWADMVCQHLIQVDCNSIAKAQFGGSIHLRKIAHVDVSQVESCAQHVARTTRLIAQADDEYFLLNIQRQGSSLVRQDGREASLVSGDMALYSSARRYELAFDSAFLQTVLVFPAEMMRTMIPTIDALTATTLSGHNPTSKLLTLMADIYFQTPFETLSMRTAAHAAQALTEIFAANIAELSAGVDTVKSSLTHFQMTRIKQYILKNLNNPNLSIQNVSQALQISPSHIHRLFKVEGQTVSAWIWTHRLFACKLALEDPAKSHLTISQILYDCGFSNASHFSRAFRNKFGITAQEWRKK